MIKMYRRYLQTYRANVAWAQTPSDPISQQYLPRYTLMGLMAVPLLLSTSTLPLQLNKLRTLRGSQI